MERRAIGYGFWSNIDNDRGGLDDSLGTSKLQILAIVASRMKFCEKDRSTLPDVLFWRWDILQRRFVA